MKTKLTPLWAKLFADISTIRERRIYETELYSMAKSMQIQLSCWNLNKRESGFDKITRFYKTTSKYHDSFYVLNEKMKEKNLSFRKKKNLILLNELTEFFKKAGRNGWNKSEMFEIVTETNIIIDLKCRGLEEKSVSDYRKIKNGGIDEINHILPPEEENTMNEFEFVSQKVLIPFVKELIENIKEVVKKYEAKN